MKKFQKPFVSDLIRLVNRKIRKLMAAYIDGAEAKKSAFIQVKPSLNELNDSWATEISAITEQEVQQQVSMSPDEVRGVIRLS